MTDYSSWDSELDGPDSCDSDLDPSDEDEPAHLYEQPRYRGRYVYEEEETEFERDPWNAVCVLGLRVFSQDTDVTIEVQNGEGDRKKSDSDDRSSIISVRRKEKELDVDDSAADATSPLRTRGNIDSVLAQKVPIVGSAPAGKEVDRQGTMS
jgi:hypothetical protein